MARYQRTEGICLRRLDYSNTSQIATFLIPDAGRLPFICKGIRRAPKKGISRGLELGARYRLVYFKRRNSSLYTLTEHPMVESFRGARLALERVLCVYYAIELMRNFTAEQDPCPGLYDLLTHSLKRFATGNNLGLSVLFLELGVLQDYGALPSFLLCAECGQQLRSRGRLTFSAHYGGPLCRPCTQEVDQRRRSSLPVRGRRLSQLAELCDHPISCLEEVDIPPKEIVAMSRLLRFHIRYLMGKELKMWKYLHGRHLSHALKRIRSVQQERRTDDYDERVNDGA